jgi:mannan endo-1,4-beta-mannosidase
LIPAGRPAGRTVVLLQAWVEEMAPYVKSVDGGRHLVTAGLEGFYGDGAHESKDLNPWGIYYGTNYVATHRAAGVDFATIHLYPDVWLWGAGAAAKLAFLRNWTRSHAAATELYLGKPLLVAEYGKFLWEGVAGANRTQRDRFLGTVLDSIYDSAARGGPIAGGAFWQLLDPGMDALRDGYEIILPEDRRAAGIIGNHSRQLAQLNGQDVEAVRRRRRRRRRRWRRRRSARISRKVHLAGSSSDDGTPQLHVFLARLVVSLLRSVYSMLLTSV